ncbi:MAG: hypothetical protein RLZ15_438 [Actinomycetota bacterium]
MLHPDFELMHIEGELRHQGMRYFDHDVRDLDALVRQEFWM